MGKNSCGVFLILDRDSEILRQSRQRGRSKPCPDPTVWYEVAAGIVPASKRSGYFEHLGGCKACGALLRDAIADLDAENLDPLDEEHIRSLESARPEWQKRLAQRIAGKIAEQNEAAHWWSRWRLPHLATVAAVLAPAVILAYSLERELAQKLIVQAYSDDRTITLRIAGASYSEFKPSRGGVSSLVDRPRRLLLAELLIASRLGSQSKDPQWLQTKAQADLLDGHYDAAQETLNRALELAPDSPGILIDLATSVSQKGHPAVAFEYLSRPLAVRPDDPVALFNRALIAEQLNLHKQALDDWDRYLRIDPASKWSTEARARAELVRRKLSSKESKYGEPLLAPEQFSIAAAANPAMGHNAEEYLAQAIRAWLPGAYPERAVTPNPAARQALFFLADLTNQQHGDRWLADLLNHSQKPLFPKAVAALSRAAKANDVGNYEHAREESGLADSFFEASSDPAGSVAAKFELSFSDQMLRDSTDCRQKSALGMRVAKVHSYRLLAIQLGLERSLCAGLMGNLGEEKKGITDALAEADEAGYKGSSLRALGFKVDNLVDSGDLQEAMNAALTALGRYSSEQFPPNRGYNLYVELSSAAEATNLPNLQVAALQEAVALAESNPDFAMRAAAHASMATAALSARRPELAEREFAEASRLYALAPQTGAVRNNRIETEISIARLEANQRRFDNAFRRLTSVQSEIQGLTNNFLQLKFYSILGEVELRRERPVEAEQSLQSAMKLAERKLASLHTETERIDWRIDVRPLYLAMAEAKLLQGRTEESLDIFEWYLGAEQGIQKLGLRDTNSQSQAPASNLASRLPLLSEATVLSYGILPDGLQIWVYDNRGVTARWIPGDTQKLQDLAARFHDLTSDHRSEMSAVRRDARSLYQALIAPIEDRLAPERSLIVELEGPLTRVPFEALLDPDGHYLVERTPIVHSLGLESDAALRTSRAIHTSLPALVVGSVASSQADGLVPLPDVAAEADTVAGEFSSARVLKGDTATLSAVKRELPDASVFHFAGHSLFTPERTGLLLADNEGRTDNPLLLEPEELRRLRLDSLQIAVLSACSTAAGSGGSRGFPSVTEVFLRAGVPHVVASRWAVDSVATRPFLEDYYRNLLSGIPVSQVTRLTSRKIMANPATSHPYYWSAFAAYGRP